MTRIRFADALPLFSAAARLGLRRSRAAVRRTEIASPLAPGSRIEAGAGAVLVLERSGATAIARGLGLTSAEADGAWAQGVLTGLTVLVPGSAPVALLCRIDHGTASAELHLSPRGAVPEGAAAAVPLAAIAARLLDRAPQLRRVGVTIPEGHPLGAALVAAGFVDEGWAAPVHGTGESRMFTTLRA
ncbi:hypothetical protein [Tsukamurella paurometabola]|uniref:GNAT family N-acetyltransferase n=1 Tax=Tsukamurella paurometabola TaxID=2061 RepID=A0ABS5NGQ2_TSUPA|nr:hypothetical protein [Tsukamurella paurometabola]MBS4103481.1 hypothetical protein [Tsukamurella paurometabola]